MKEKELIRNETNESKRIFLHIFVKPNIDSYEWSEFFYMLLAYIFLHMNIFNQ